MCHPTITPQQCHGRKSSASQCLSSHTVPACYRNYHSVVCKLKAETQSISTYRSLPSTHLEAPEPLVDPCFNGLSTRLLVQSFCACFGGSNTNSHTKSEVLAPPYTQTMRGVLRAHQAWGCPTADSRSDSHLVPTPWPTATGHTYQSAPSAHVSPTYNSQLTGHAIPVVLLYL